MAGDGYNGTWMRDLVYAAAGSGDAIPAPELGGNLALFYERQLDDGSLPCAILLPDGQPTWAGPYRIPDLDSHIFAAIGCALVVKRSGELDFYENRRRVILRAIGFLPRDGRSGLVWVDPGTTHVSYGFHDTVFKPGRELFCSALLAIAFEELSRLEGHVGNRVESERFGEEALRVRAGLKLLWNDEGYFHGYDGGDEPSPPDVFGTAFAVCEGLVEDARADRAARWLRDHIDSIFWNGHVRPVPAPASWPLTTLAPEEIAYRGIHARYQSTHYWQMALAWLACSIARVDEPLARRLAETYVRWMREFGIWECVEPPDVFKGPDNLSSICVPASYLPESGNNAGT